MCGDYMTKFRKDVIKIVADKLGITEEDVDEIVKALSELVKEDVGKFIDRRSFLAGALLMAISLGPGAALARTVVTDKYITIDEREVLTVPKDAKDGQIIVKQGDGWVTADPSVDKWAGQQLTPRDITLDIKRLTEATLSYFKSFRVFTPNFFKPLRTFNLYAEVPSDSGSEISVEVRSGDGVSDETVEYIAEGEMVWIESAGLIVEFSSTPDITWNSGKYIRLSRKHYPHGSNNPVTNTELYGGKSDSLDNWRHILALSESIHYIENNRMTSKSHTRYDFIAQNNYHYWFVNEHGDEYIKLSADAGCFTWSNDKPILYMKGMVFSVEDVLSEPST